MASPDYQAGYAAALELAYRILCPYCAEGVPWRWNDYAGAFEHEWPGQVARACRGHGIRVAARAAAESAGDGAGSGDGNDPRHA